jgi:hypothetical protein
MMNEKHAKAWEDATKHGFGIYFLKKIKAYYFFALMTVAQLLSTSNYTISHILIVLLASLIGAYAYGYAYWFFGNRKYKAGKK